MEHPDGICEMPTGETYDPTELRCPKCGHEVFERVMEVKAVDSASYEDGKLVIKQEAFEVHESYIRCAGCFNQEWTNLELGDLLEIAIEELFL